jgi:hypothetical protein
MMRVRVRVWVEGEDAGKSVVEGTICMVGIEKADEGESPCSIESRSTRVLAHTSGWDREKNAAGVYGHTSTLRANCLKTSGQDKEEDAARVYQCTGTL